MPIRNNDNEIIGLLGFSLDITEFKQQQEKMEKERDYLVKMANQIAHDIRSPLATIKMILNACSDIRLLSELKHIK